ncbi:MAG TPA: ribosomal protein S18-alanine N-acetyltransferase [Gemmatimonadaceae bacterium]|nr:ribosomal protein S18-alanine N-acetyltransferase [Gemmatimonadaceae bacterium]
MNAPVVIRPAASADLSGVVEIERASFSDPWSLTAFRSALREERINFHVALSGGSIAGYAISWCVVDEAELANLAVMPSLRGQRIGAALLDRAMADARQAGCVVMHLEVRESNAAARALYESHGFGMVGRRKRYYREPIEDALILRARLVE